MKSMNNWIIKPVTDLKGIKLIDHYCAYCKKHYKVLKPSNSKYCSELCYDLNGEPSKRVFGKIL